MNLSTVYFLYKDGVIDDEVLSYKKKREEMRERELPIWEKKCLTIDEAAEYSGVGRTLLRKLVAQRNCPFVLMSGNQYFIVREKFDTYINSVKHLK